MPSISSLDDNFSEENNYLQDCIQDINLIPVFISNYKKIFSISEPLDCILAIDVASLDRPNQKKTF